MSQASFNLKYDGPALREHTMNVRDLAPAMLAVGEAFEALNSLYNGKEAKVSVNVRAHEPGSFSVLFDVYQALKDSTAFLAGTEVTAAVNLLGILGISAPTGTGLIWLIKRLRGRKPERIETIAPGMFRLTVGEETVDVPMDLLKAYQDISVRRAVEGFVGKPLQKPGITEVIIEDEQGIIAHVSKADEPSFRAPELESDIVVDDTRRAAFTIRDLSFDEEGYWRLFDGTSPVKAKIEDERFLGQVERDEIRFAKHDVLVCMVHFVQRRSAKGLTNEHTVIEVIEYIPAPRQLRFPDPDEPQP